MLSLQSKLSEPKINQLLTKLDYLEIGHWGCVCWLAGQPPALACTMALDPEEVVTLTDHGPMKLRSAVTRAMMLLPKERKRATIVREGEPAILKFEQIKNLAAQWDEGLWGGRVLLKRSPPSDRRTWKIPKLRRVVSPAFRGGYSNVVTASLGELSGLF